MSRYLSSSNCMSSDWRIELYPGQKINVGQIGLGKMGRDCLEVVHEEQDGVVHHGRANPALLSTLISKNMCLNSNRRVERVQDFQDFFGGQVKLA